MHALDRFAAVLPDQNVEVPKIRGYRAKRFGLFLPLKPLSCEATSDVRLAIYSYWRNENDLLWIWVGRWCQQHALDEIENCGGRSDTERQGHNGHGGEARVLAQHPQSESEILQKSRRSPGEMNVASSGLTSYEVMGISNS